MTERDAFELRFHSAMRRYVGRVSSDLDTAELARRIAVAHPRSRAGAWPRALLPARAFAWVALFALLLAALGGTAFVASRLLETPPQLHRLNVQLVPTGIDVLTPATGDYTRVVADDTGILWALEGDGRLVRFDPATGAGGAWTVSDDAAFAATNINPARGGGVWLVGTRTLRWFDGSLFREVIDAPADVTLSVEAPDATLWAATMDGAVLHWDGSAWSRLDPGRPNADAAVNAIAVDAAGRPWIGWTQYPGPPSSGWVSRHDGSTWTTFDAKDAAPLGGSVSTIAQLPDGGIGVATTAGLARFDGSSRTDATAGLPARNTAWVAAGPNGQIWAAAGDGGNSAGIVRRFDGRTWVSYGLADGLPWGSATAGVVSTKAGTYVGGGTGIFRFSNGRWDRAWPEEPPQTMNLATLLAVSRDDLWATGDTGAWHFHGGAWSREAIDPTHPGGVVSSLALAPDGTLWAAGTDGVAYRRDGGWTIVDTQVATVIAADGTGTVWAGDGRTGCELWTLQFDGTAWTRHPVASVCPFNWGLSSLAIDGGGALWVADSGGWVPGGLARFDGQRWETFPEIGNARIYGATILGTAPGGSVWIEAAEILGTTSGSNVADRLQPRLYSRSDGTGWTEVQLPRGEGRAFAMAPDGTVWAAVYIAATTKLARHEGQQWAYSYADVPWAVWVSQAPDGSVFVIGAGGVLRLPAVAPTP